LRFRSTIVVLGTLIALSLAAAVGCSREPEMCSVSPIDIEETQSDSRDLDTDLSSVQERLKAAQDDLARWQTRLADRRAEVPRLKEELRTLKKASGVTEDMVTEVEPKPSEDDFEIIPRAGR